jgi:hypothetical protein
MDALNSKENYEINHFSINQENKYLLVTKFVSFVFMYWL